MQVNTYYLSLWAQAYSCPMGVSTRVGPRVLCNEVSRPNSLIYETQIPVGARYVGIPETETAENPKGLMVEVYWEQDDSGALCISGHSREVPIPVNVELPITSSSAPTRGVFGGRGKIQGLVINPDKISESIFRR